MSTWGDATATWGDAVVTWNGEGGAAPPSHGGRPRRGVRIAIQWTLDEDDADLAEILGVLLDR